MKMLFQILAAVAAVTATPALAVPAAKPQATLFKNPQCGCCEEYGTYLRDNGYDVKVVPTNDLALIKQRQGIPPELGGCHTTFVGGYYVDGHVPIGSFDRLLAERPEINGITLPGMPAGSPGMGGAKTGPFTILALAKGGERSVYAVE
jgi:hypothetical protein